MGVPKGYRRVVSSAGNYYTTEKGEAVAGDTRLTPATTPGECDACGSERTHGFSAEVFTPGRGWESAGFGCSIRCAECAASEVLCNIEVGNLNQYPGRFE